MQNNLATTPKRTLLPPQHSVDLIDTVDCLVERSIAITRCLWLSIDNGQIVITRDDIGRVCNQIESNLEEIQAAANTYHEHTSQNTVQARKAGLPQKSALRGMEIEADVILEGSQHKLKLIQQYLQRREEFDTDSTLIGCENVIADLHISLGEMRHLVSDMSREIGGMKKKREVA